MRSEIPWLTVFQGAEDYNITLKINNFEKKNIFVVNIWTLSLYNVIAPTVNPETFIIIFLCEKNSNLSIFGTFVYHSQLPLKLCNNFCLFLPFSSIESSTTASRQDGWIAPSQLQGGHVWKFGKHLEKHLVKYQHSQWSFDKYNLILLFIVITCPATWLPRFLVTWRWPRSELQANFSLSYIHSVWQS